MNNEDRLKARAELKKARDHCNHTIDLLRPDLPYAHADMTELERAKKPILLMRKKLENPYPPLEPKVTLTKYRMFENAKILAAVTPGDLGDLYWPFTMASQKRIMYRQEKRWQNIM